MTAVTDSFLARLPLHERRRLEALAGVDHEMLARRRWLGEPLQYLEGTAPFGDVDLHVDHRVLVPRPETEGLVELAASLAGSPGVVVDLGTGSGAIAIALARRFPHAEVHAADVAAEALEVAQRNVVAFAPGVRLHEGDLFEALPADLRGRVDLVVSNPPYVAEGEWDALPADVRREPPSALVAGPIGTEVLERIAGEVGEWLVPGGKVVCEIGERQSVVAGAFSHLGRVSVRPDLAGRPRYLVVETG
jgi:release factor glutamine methyltransferase